MPLPIDLPDESFRVELTISGDQLAIRRVYQVEARAPTGQELVQRERDEAASGFWIEQEDLDGKTLYRRVLDAPARHRVEHFHLHDPGLVRHEVTPARRTFSILVPAWPATDTRLVVFAPTDDDHGRRLRAEPRWTLPLPTPLAPVD